MSPRRRACRTRAPRGRRGARSSGANPLLEDAILTGADALLMTTHARQCQQAPTDHGDRSPRGSLRARRYGFRPAQATARRPQALGITGPTCVEHARQHVHSLWSQPVDNDSRGSDKTASDLRQHRPRACGPEKPDETFRSPFTPRALGCLQSTKRDRPGWYPQEWTGYTQPWPPSHVTDQSRHLILTHVDWGDDRDAAARAGHAAAGPGDPAAGRAGLPRPRRRAAVPARGRRHRRPPRHPASSPGSASPARSCRPRSGCACSSPTAPPRRWPGGSAPATCRGALRPGRGRGLAGGPDRRRSPRWRGSLLGDRLVGLFGPDPAVGRARHDVPAAGLPRRRPAAGDAGRHRDPARAPGHPHAAGGRRGGQPREHRAQLPAGLRPGPGHRRAPRSAPTSPSWARRWRWSRSWSGPPAGRARRCGPTSPGSAARPTPAWPSWSAR